MPNESNKQSTDPQQILPAWFVPRMMGDMWIFGLLLTTGQVLAVQHIDNVSQAANGDIWLDVTLAEHVVLSGWLEESRVVAAPTSRLTASVNASHVVAALELADT